MARFDVHPNPAGQGYLLNVQSDLLAPLNTCVVVPLIALSEAPTPAKRLNPILQIDGEDYVMVTQFMAAVKASILKAPITNTAERADEITNALDMLFVGF